MTPTRNLRITIDDRVTVLTARQGAHLVHGDARYPAQRLELGERDAPVWCTVDVHAPESAAVGATLSPRPGRPRFADADRRTVALHIRLTPDEAERLGLSGPDRHELARARLLGGAE